MVEEYPSGMKRRTFLEASGGLAAVPLLSATGAQGAIPFRNSFSYPAFRASRRRSLGSLVVSGVGRAHLRHRLSA